MHYGSFEFSKNGGRTIQTLDQAKEDLLGQDNRPYYNRGVCLNLIKNKSWLPMEFGVWEYSIKKFTQKWI